MRRRWLAVGIGPLAALAFLVLAVTPVAAAGAVGTGTAASCDEAAFDTAFAGGGAITFNCGLDPVTITFTGTKILTADTTITGNGLITLSGGGAVLLFATTGFDLTLTGLTLRDAIDADYGAVAFATNANVVLIDSTVMDNSAGFGAAVALFANDGGAHAIAANGSTFVGNSVTNDGGLFYVRASTFDGDVCLGTPVEVNVILINSTFTGNSAAGFGDIVLLDADSPGCGDTGQVLVAYSTIAGNTGDELFSISPTVDADFGSNVIGPNAGDCIGGGGTTSSFGYNVTDDAGCLTTVPGDQVVADTMLGPLADNGGLTQTMALLPGSPALDAIPFGEGECGDVALDQRDIVRPQGANCDSGAYEQVLLTDTALAAPAPVSGLAALVLGFLFIGLLGALRLSTAHRRR